MDHVEDIPQVFHSLKVMASWGSLMPQGQNFWKHKGSQQKGDVISIVC